MTCLTLETQARTRRRLVVVGVDGSPNSIAALRRGAEEAAKNGARLRAVYVHRAGAGRYDPRPSHGGPRFDLTGLQDAATAHQGAVDARADLKHAVHDAVGEDPPVEVEQVVRMGGARDVLVKEAREADLLVVGARGHSGERRALLGTTAQFCAAHASCAVLVVPLQAPKS